jgi:hypothetical protein
MVANTQSKRKPRNQQNAVDQDGVFYSAEYLETRRKVSPLNVESCQHCGANHQQLRCVCSWEWHVPAWKCWEGGYVYGCLSCLKQGHIEWKKDPKPRRSLWKDGG